ncbi:hypothetical protein BJ508DRAFT_304059 [Ascobolus immersus RN42]|uniref:Velvet domain-containing protein n=1 Tax=Ascobolus immersus RN42 TaxID=1160509 RepID=A0A3N4IDN6_ASCIM|nr:hypothetical protein BJ508DRAFT_304059 [Ascobolus immersus RN42]
MSSLPLLARPSDVPETTAFSERTLPDGTKIQYRLSVIQQPQRARACGMGAKAHADRRPVDPPPVVDLRIFSGEGYKTDITFSHNSNFFLYATLEPARPIAQGRGMTPAPHPPVLTGVPVSGMAYLDRPYPGGYFIFPDLSVRHEGTYRLRFSLFEESKDAPAPGTEDGEPAQEYVFHRVEVESQPFTVFSAKKFPGLSESTALSRTVAEQGCRVRIRRDVRMRKRTDKHRSGDHEEDETASYRSKRQTSPSEGAYQQSERKRSDSMISSGPVQVPVAQAYTNNYQPPMVQSTYQDFAARPRSPVQSRPVQQQSQNPFSQQHEQNPQHIRRQSNDFYRRESEYRQPAIQQQRPQTPQHYQAQISYQPQYQQPQPQYQPAMQPKYEQTTQTNSANPVRLPPLEPKWRQESGPAPLPSPRPYVDLMQQHIKVQESYSPVSMPESTSGTKRSWGSVFNEDNVAGRFTKGMRPSDNLYGVEAEEDDDDILGAPMMYRRADGVQVQRNFSQFSRAVRRM